LVELAAGAFGVKLQYVDVLSPKDLEPAFRASNKGQADAGLMMVSGRRRRFSEKRDYTTCDKEPATGDIPKARIRGSWGLINYGLSYSDLYHRAATYVDKILKGVKPAELHVEQPTKFEFVINLNNAKQLGLTIPQSVRYRADKVIKMTTRAA
jgi:putative tryptophan/tyrosine transport system substrate-binding protein